MKRIDKHGQTRKEHKLVKGPYFAAIWVQKCSLFRGVRMYGVKMVIKSTVLPIKWVKGVGYRGN